MGTAGSVTSGFKFESYKIDNISFQSTQSPELLAFKGVIPEEEWIFRLNIRNPFRWKSAHSYICGVDVNVRVLTTEGKERHENGEEPEDQDVLIELTAGIAGLFKVDGDGFSPEAEESLCKTQGPALLLAHLRGTVTSLLANAGFGTFIIPLINIHETAKRTLADVTIQDLDEGAQK